MMKKKRRNIRNENYAASLNWGLYSLAQQLEAYVVALRSAAHKRDG